MYKEQLLREALNLSPNAISYYVGQILADRFPKKALVEGIDGLFDIEEYRRAGNCTIESSHVVYNETHTFWVEPRIGPTDWSHNTLRIGGMVSSNAPPAGNRDDDKVLDREQNAWVTVTWQEHKLDVIVMHWSEGFNTAYYFWILADTQEVARAFLKEVCRWNAEVRSEVLVFSGGCWQKDEQLFQAIKNATFENLILKGGLKEDIHRDLTQFFAARATYEMYGIPWKRGILFVGPPGNGKTHAVKAIINAMDQPCLYVKSFHTEHMTDEDNMRAVFERARKSAPCILVLEDLDSLLNPQNRSYFLNELDGFAANVGIVTLATTNHPERLDPAILDRPSRFDRKYPFDLPALAEREAYIAMWNDSLQQALRLSAEATHKLAELTEDFSFAYLKELFLSSMMRWISDSQQGSMEETMLGQVKTLHEQMVSVVAVEVEVEPAEQAPGSQVGTGGNHYHIQG